MKAAVCFLVAFLALLTGTQRAGVTGSPTTKAPGKPGTCPTTDNSMGLLVCNDACGSSDYNCEGNRKCCKTFCNDGRWCQIPDNKPGNCPANANETTCDTIDHCKSDTKCEGDKKCCSSCCHDPV